MPPSHTITEPPPAAAAAAVPSTVVDLDATSVTELNALLQGAPGGRFAVQHPAGKHNLAVGLTTPVHVQIDGHAGYYCAGMNQLASIEIAGNVSSGVAENMMSGRVHVRGSASQAAAATANGGLLVIDGDAGARCGISLKGGDIVVRGSAGHATGFMAQSGRIVICGDAGDALGDSLYEARIYVRGAVTGLGADCIEKPMADEHRAEVEELLAAAGCDDLAASGFRRYGSARSLYRFTADRIEG